LDDLVCDSVLTLVENIHAGKVDNQHALRRYVRRIAVRRAIDYIRRWRVEQGLPAKIPAPKVFRLA
jgi:DNA-directed RNA polymerase specialized sigma24 family protein